MADRLFDSFALRVLLLPLVVFICGCGNGDKRSDESVLTPNHDTNQATMVSGTNDLDEVSESVRVLTPEQQKASEMRGCVDRGNNSRALSLARTLLRSRDKSVKSDVITTLEWVGRRAMPEIVELMADKDQETATLAFRAWEQVFATYASDEQRSEAISSAAARVENHVILDGIMLKAMEISSASTAGAMLDGIVRSNRGREAARRAKEMYEFISGEKWSEKAISSSDNDGRIKVKNQKRKGAK